MLVAWVGITRQAGSNPGFAASGSRPLAFIEQGKLVHEITRDVYHRATGVPAISVRLSIRIELNHDRVLSQSIESCLDDIGNSNYTLHDSLRTGDYTFIANYASGRINDVNGESATKTVRVLKAETIAPPKPIASQ